MSKKKHKKHQKYDYSEIDAEPEEIRAIMKQYAKDFKLFKKVAKRNIIFGGMKENESKKQMKVLKKLIKKLKKGDPSVFDIDVLNELLHSNRELIIGNKR